MKIRYEIKDGKGITPCHYNSSVMLGSYICGECIYNIKMDKEKQIIECGKITVEDIVNDIQ